MDHDDNRKITDLQKEEIDVQREILGAIRKWHLTSVYIAVILTIYLGLRLVGVN